MRKDYEKLFSRLDPPEPPPGLLSKIMFRIRKEEVRALRLRFAAFALVFAGSAAGLIPAFRAVRISAAESGFTQFLSLALSDFRLVSAYWQDLGLALAESLPVVSAAALLVLVLAALTSLKLMYRYGIR